MKILMIGDTYGRPGRKALVRQVPLLIQAEGIDFVVANGENIAAGNGLTPDTCNELFDAGVDVITTGNHVRDKKEIDPMLETDERIIRPMNYPATMPGRGHTVRKARNGTLVGVMNVMGAVHIRGVDSPFPKVMDCIAKLKEITPVLLLDVHAEATSEKRAMGWYLDGVATAVVGTHTHVQTADEEILPKGTAYMSDLGMTGPYHSVIGLKIEHAMERFLENKRDNFDVGRGDVRFCGALIEVDELTGRARSIRRIRQDFPDLR